MLSKDLIQQAQQWIAQDPDSQTAHQLQELLDQSAQDESALAQLTDMFSESLQFGTAGLRGALGPGPNRMNRVTVLRAAVGLGQYLLANGLGGEPVVIGFDGRHNSEQFAEDSAEVLAGMGFKPMIFGDVIPTPVLAFTILEQKACAGVMVTASHNPAKDNGYKVYLGDGRQIVAPVDSQIAQYIAKVNDVRELVRSHNIITLGIDAVHKYVDTTAGIVRNGPVATDDIEAVRYVYTAMHGVGYRTFSYVMKEAGFGSPEVVVQQRDPDPDFPTTPFPNPEEAGALNLAIAHAQSVQSEIVIAHDPDADRLAVALLNDQHQWKQLQGDQVGALLGWWMIQRAELLNVNLQGAFANSIVSSKMLSRIAEDAGLHFEQTLTGFKWVSRVPDLLYGYEEALGYSIDPIHVRDKDGISAAMLFLEMSAWLHAKKQTVWGVLDDLAKRYGVFATKQVSQRIASVEQVKTTLTQLLESRLTHIASMKVANVIDLSTGSHLPPTDGIVFELVLDGEMRTEMNSNVEQAFVTIRPSGTEPKLKCYFEVICRTGDVSVSRLQAEHQLEQLASTFHDLLK